ncbi:bifunctional transaldolase/phosoglucose isomerase [Phototrophicus methaneseepsis]|uniref:Transaldolase n=1 Tax=Phototrophicus methaneseepsis TaxID=2710758 RepID=A0A7S8EC99_9CHLR|nr:bifunctional transaldolase/phosoglucose isomerase [Phototrophicus methaneseepsis]QPC84337.1 bifunctional transaldolase/phosoglucose isomerase [Phototrophicus methaneseepsis]
MAENPAFAVQEIGQSLWLDFIHRKALQDGEFQRRIDEEGVVGVTSNPSIFQKAIGDSDTYDEAIRANLDLSANEIYESLAIADIQQATDLFRPIYDKTNKQDGYVSLEVSPLLASSTEETITEAKRLFKAVDRPNVMIKIPATPAGIPAIEEVIAAGVNVNVTLIFSVENYEQVAEAFIKGLERRLEAGESVEGIASVASFFLSRIDNAVDNILKNNMRAAQVHGDTTRIAANRRMLGQAAIANAKLAYRSFQRVFEGQRFAKLKAAGAQVQRPLWASTSTKDPAYPDTMYVDQLIGKDTVNTLPPNTLEAFVDHGTVEGATILRNNETYLDPTSVMENLAELGIDMGQVTHRLQVDGVDAFIESFEKLMQQVAAKRTLLKTGLIDRQKLALGIYNEQVSKAQTEMDKSFIVGRIWSGDGSVWKDHGPTIEKIQNRLGWLHVLNTIDIERLKQLQASIKDSNVTNVVLLGMGGSSLAPEVMYKTFGKAEGFPELKVLDSTDPARIQAVEDSIDLPNTLFIVASKSGGTVETMSFYKHFYEKTGHNGSQFIAITDPETSLAQLAQEKAFRDVFINPADIGGRYSALSYFGMVPAALIGIDLDRAWSSARTMIEANRPEIPAAFHPGLTLGAVIGALAKEGRDKVSIFTTASISSFGDWAEQLLAESLGKEGKGALPVVGATVGKPHDYSSDRLFLYLRIDDDSNLDEVDEGIRTLREAGHPRMTLRLPNPYALFGEFFRWEFATAVAGYQLEVNPFDEPNVTEAKEATKELLQHYQEHGSLPQSEPFIDGTSVKLYADETTVAPLRELGRAHNYDEESRTQVLAAQITGTNTGDYFALLVYLTPDEETEAKIQEIRRRLRHVTRRAVTLGYGPRYLHSTGQFHKGGPNNGVFIQITANVETDIDIPGEPYSFGTLFQAQAAGDLQALHNHNRRAFRFHIDGDIDEGLQKLLDAIEFVENRNQ